MCGMGHNSSPHQLRRDYLPALGYRTFDEICQPHNCNDLPFENSRRQQQSLVRLRSQRSRATALLTPQVLLKPTHRFGQGQVRVLALETMFRAHNDFELRPDAGRQESLMH